MRRYAVAFGVGAHASGHGSSEYVCKPYNGATAMSKADEQDDDRALLLEQISEKVRDLLSGKYAPASTPADANDMITSTQFHSIIDEHAPDLVERSMLREVLLKLGYQEHRVGDELRWLVTTP